MKSQICISHYKGEETSQYLIERSLMRPRNLLKMLAHRLGFVVNLGRERIEQADIEKGLKAYSLDLITDDVAPDSYPVGLRVWWLPSCTIGTSGQGAEPASAAPWPCCDEKFAA